MFAYLEFKRNKIISRILNNKLRGMLHNFSQKVIIASITGQ